MNTFAYILSQFASCLVAVSIMVPILVRFWRELVQMRTGYAKVWTGIVQRGFVEAQTLGHLKHICDSWVVSASARLMYASIAPDLQRLYGQIRQRLGRSPTDDELGWEIEQKHQKWMLANACPGLGLNEHGCLAIAGIIAREGGLP